MSGVGWVLVHADVSCLAAQRDRQVSSKVIGTGRTCSRPKAGGGQLGCLAQEQTLHATSVLRALVLAWAAAGQEIQSDRPLVDESPEESRMAGTEASEATPQDGHSMVANMQADVPAAVWT